MIKSDDIKHLSNVIKAQQVNGQDYIQDVLQPAIKLGDWDELEELDVGYFSNGESFGLICENIWPVKDWFVPDDAIIDRVLDLNFTDGGRIFVRNIANELKSLMLSMLWLPNKRKHSLKTCYDTLTVLRKVANALIKDGQDSFSALTTERIADWITRGDTEINFLKPGFYAAVNKLIVEKVRLSFTLSIAHISETNFNLQLDDNIQAPVMPPRIYNAALTYCEQKINDAYARRDDLANLATKLSHIYDNYYELYADVVFKNGAGDLKYLTKSESTTLFKTEYDRQPNLTNAELVTLLKQMTPTIQLGHVFNAKRANLTFDGKSISLPKARSILSGYLYPSQYTTLTLSGMRIDELHRLHTVQAIETVKIQGQTIHAIRTDTSKITGDTQVKQDEFVTTDLGKRAIEVADCIMKPIRNCAIKEHSNYFFHTYGTLSSFAEPCTKHNLSSVLVAWFSVTFDDELMLNGEDMKYLAVSDPAQIKHELGEKWVWSPHQCRRSLAYYLIGYELLGFPQLKQQFSHFSLAMTRYYARNASRFNRWLKSTTSMPQEIQSERIRQQAEIYLSIYQKMANNDRIGGGRAVEEYKTMSRNDFSDVTERDMLTIEYWENQLLKNKRHLHAVAPGIYCTNTKCSMRIAVSLIDCVDCPNDFVVDAVFAEAKRKEAEVNMYYDIANDELTASNAAAAYKAIFAAERIMKDLSVDFEPVKFPIEVVDLLKLQINIVKI
ncbi:MAG: hypothetical protein ACI88H_001303 [Cocleimonas sp.]|jgi:hypothetical protein